MDINTIGKNKIKPGLPKLSPGDNVRVSFKIKEASRERVQTFPGLIIKVTKHNSGGNFTVRRVTSGIGVEHTFPLASPLLEKIEVVRHGKVRRAKLYYIRRLSTKEARLKERRDRIADAIAPVPVEDMLTAPEPEAPAGETKEAG
jgi:large subunit ribosomal protein L19